MDKLYTIVAIDDEKDVLRALDRTLRNEGYNFIVAHNADELLAIVKDSHVDLVITDYSMPGCTGLDLLNKIVEIGKDPAKMILTGTPESFDLLEEMARLGMYKLVWKPWKNEELLAAIRDLLENYSKRA
jgi:DNA-binding NtrC family response regulator